MKPKEGDLIEVLATNGECPEMGLKVGDRMKVKCIDWRDDTKVYLFDNPHVGEKCKCGKHSWSLEEDQYKIITNEKSIMANLKEKFALAFKGEPEKSFIKAGIMNSDESLTSDGREIFLAWLLKKHGDDFKKEVADPILADEKTK